MVIKDWMRGKSVPHGTVYLSDPTLPNVNLSPQVFHCEDGSTLIEWVDKNYRFGISIENNLTDSGWWFAIKSGYGCSGVLPKELLNIIEKGRVLPCEDTELESLIMRVLLRPSDIFCSAFGDNPASRVINAGELLKEKI